MTASRTSERLPNWTLEETLLAWELYLAEYADPLRYPDGAHAAVKRLSHQLRNLTIHPASVRSSERFRNPSGVARKIQNLMFFDTDGAAGSENGSAVDRRVAAGSRQLDDVSRLAAEVRRGRRLTDIDVGPEARSEDAAPVSPSDYASAIDLLESFQGDLENEVLQKRRVEQRFLRQKLFGTRSHGTCSLCGRELPVDLLVAAHIKARADCSRDEKLDVGNIVMAACHLGCDVLYERGYLAVDKRGIVVTASMDPSEPVAEELSRREGRLCASFTDGTASYFAAHYERVFRGARGS